MKQRVAFFALTIFLVTGSLYVLSFDRIKPDKNDKNRISSLTISLTPTQDPDQLLKKTKPLVSYLEEKLNCEIKIKQVTDYFSMVQALQGNHIDVAFMPGLPIIFSIRTADCVPLCIEIQRGQTYYYSHVYARKDNPSVKNLADLKGKSIAFTDPVSSSGFLYPVSLFYEKGLIEKGAELNSFFKKVYWAGGYESALLSMFNGHVDASCGSQHAPTWYLDDEQKKEVRVIGKAGPLPTHGIVARKALGEETLNLIQDTLMELNQPQYESILKDLYHADGLELADEKTYLSVLQKAEQTGLFKDALSLEKWQN